MTSRIAVLVSIGRHPASGRDTMSSIDATALEQAMRISQAQIEVVHAGPDPEAPALRGYLGMGPRSLTVVRVPASADVVEPLAWHLATLDVDLVLAGGRGERGEASGLVPYAVASRLGAPIVAGARRIIRVDDGFEIESPQGHGKLRRFRARKRAVVTLHPGAERGRYPAFGVARRGRIDVVDPPPHVLRETAPRYSRPAGRRPAPIEPIRGATAAERLDRIQAVGRAGAARLIRHAPPEEAAVEILRLLALNDVGPWRNRSEPSG